MNEKVYIEGYIVGSFADTLGMKGKQNPSCKYGHREYR